MSVQQQLDALGISADAYQGLIVVEIAGPPIVTMTPAEARRFHAFFERAYRDALRDRDENNVEGEVSKRGRVPAKLHINAVPDGPVKLDAEVAVTTTRQLLITLETGVVCVLEFDPAPAAYVAGRLAT